MDPKYTPEEMRNIAAALRVRDIHPFCLNKAAAMLDWAVDVIEAARVALKPTSSDGAKHE